MGQVNWQLGQVLLPQHFQMQQQHAHQLSAQILCRTQGYEDGLIDLVIDENALSNNVLKLNSLAILMPDLQYAALGFNTVVDAIELDGKALKVDVLSVYLSQKPQFNKVSETVAQGSIEVEQYHFSLDFTLNQDADYSNKILELSFDQEEGIWKVLSFIPKITLLPYVYAREWLARAKNCHQEAQKALRCKCTSSNHFLRYHDLFLRLSSLHLWFSTIEESVILPSNLREKLHELYQCTSVVFEGITHYFDATKNILKDCESLLRLTESYFLDPVLSVEGYPLHYAHGIFKSDILDDQFFNSDRKYLVVEGLASNDKSSILLKCFSPSSAEQTLLRSLPGLRLVEVEALTKRDQFPDALMVMEILPEGSSWDAVVNERVICVKSTANDHKAYSLSLVCE